MSKKVYIAKSKGFYKIGVSETPEKRVAQLQCGNPFRIKLLETYDVGRPSRNVEEELHKKYSNSRVRLEWFNLTNNQLDEIKKFLSEEETTIGGPLIKITPLFADYARNLDLASY